MQLFATLLAAVMATVHIALARRINQDKSRRYQQTAGFQIAPATTSGPGLGDRFGHHRRLESRQLVWPMQTPPPGEFVTTQTPPPQASVYDISFDSINEGQGEEVEFKKSDRVRVVQDIIGEAGNRWQQPLFKSLAAAIIGRNFSSVQLFEEDFGTVNSVSSVNLRVGVILDKDVKKEVWVDADDLVKDDLPLEEVDGDTLTEYLSKTFPQSEHMAHFKCPLTGQIFRDPVVASDGRTYEKSALEEASRGSERPVKNYQINSLLQALAEKVVVPQTMGEELKYRILGENPPPLGAENLATFKCPLSLELFTDPVVASDGHTYERDSIQRVLHVNRMSPMTREPLTADLIPNRALKSLLSVLILKAGPIREANHAPLTLSVGDTSSPSIGSPSPSPSPSIGSESAGERVPGFCHGGDGEQSDYVTNLRRGDSAKSYCERHCNSRTRVQNRGTLYCCTMTQWGSRTACTVKYGRLGNLDVVYDGVSVWRPAAVDDDSDDDDD